MTERPPVTFFAEPGLAQSASAGQHNFIGKVVQVLRRNGFDPKYRDFGTDGAPAGQGRTLSHMKSPPDADGLTFRRVYHYPFWQIERHAARWDWDVAQARFDPAVSDEDEAEKFYRFWRKRLFGAHLQDIGRDGFVYVPLQGRLLSQRSFQRCSPIEMIEQTLHHDPVRNIIATLHPKESHERAELDALAALEARHPRLRIARGGMKELLKRCDYLVTQNSGVAFDAMFFGKPALLFGEIDFHHVCVSADMDRLGDSFAQVAQHRPPYAAYLHWFWQKRCINAGRPDAEDRIAQRLRRFAWIA